MTNIAAANPLMRMFLLGRLRCTILFLATVLLFSACQGQLQNQLLRGGIVPVQHQRTRSNEDDALSLILSSNQKTLVPTADSKMIYSSTADMAKHNNGVNSHRDIEESSLTFPIFKHHGVSFTRSVSTMANGASMIVSLKDGASHCKSHDQYGDNDCQYKWSETMEITVKSALGVDLVAGDIVSGEFDVSAQFCERNVYVRV